VAISVTKINKETKNCHYSRNLLIKTYQLAWVLSKKSSYPNIIPAMVADNKEAKDPPKTAFKPNSDRVFL
jgi:hypothetical protein